MNEPAKELQDALMNPFQVLNLRPCLLQVYETKSSTDPAPIAGHLAFHPEVVIHDLQSAVRS